MSKRVTHRRRRGKKTDYKKRYGLIKSGKDRLVVRRHNRNIKTQIIRWERDGDKTLVQANSLDLENHGWKGHPGNVPAAYLTGYLIAKKALNENIEQAILDLGLHERTKGNKIFAVVKGAREGGLEIPAGEEILPSDERVAGKHIEEYAASMSSEEKESHFSKLLDNDLDPENISENVEEVKKNIDKLGE